jgi:hypothetical protein
MGVRALQWAVCGLLLGCSGRLEAQTAQVQTIHVDVTAEHSVPFDPDKAMGTSMDILSAKDFEKVYSEPVIQAGLSAGWGPISYRQNTELTYSAWHWNPNGNWSDPKARSGYFVGSSEPKESLRQSFGYHLPHRGTTRSDAGQNEFSRITDGDPATYWKSNPYLTEKFTGEPDSAHPQWVVIEFGLTQEITAIQIQWAHPYAKKYVVEYWSGREDALNRQGGGEWVRFPHGEVNDGRGGTKLLRLSEYPIATRFLRIWMTESSNTCDTHGGEDSRNCVGYAIAEIGVGSFNSDGQFLDLVKHAPGQAQTVTQASSNDPWHTEKDIIPTRVQTGFDLFFTSGYTHHLPAMIPVAMLYSSPEDSAAQLAYLEKRGYAISYVEMGEEPDGAYMLPEDYAALYVQWAAALHKVDPKLKLGGPIFTGVNEDVQAWADAQGKTSWLGRFIDYLKLHRKMNELSFVSFEHYPFEPCLVDWSDLYREPEMLEHILKVWREDGVPANVPLMNTESNVSWALTDPMQDLFAGLWLADSVGAFLTYGGPGAVYYHSPIQPEPLQSGCHAWSTYGNFVADESLNIKQYTAQYFASQILNLDWVQHGAGVHQLFPANGDLEDDAEHNLTSAYAVKRPDGLWSLLIINKDPSNGHEVDIAFARASKDTQARFVGTVKRVTFGAAEYVWHPQGAESHADPDGPPKRESLEWKDQQTVQLPKASVTVFTGRVTGL